MLSCLQDRNLREKLKHGSLPVTGYEMGNPCKMIQSCKDKKRQLKHISAQCFIECMIFYFQDRSRLNWDFLMEGWFSKLCFLQIMLLCYNYLNFMLKTNKNKMNTGFYSL